MGPNTLRLALILAAPLALAACSAPPAAPLPPRMAEARPRQDLNLVLPSAFCNANPASYAEYSADAYRRDTALSVGTLTAELGPAYYQGEVPPSLEDARWLNLSCNPRRMLYLEPRRDRRRR